MIQRTLDQQEYERRGEFDEAMRTRGFVIDETIQQLAEREVPKAMYTYAQDLYTTVLRN